MINTLKESSLHKSLKLLYSLDGGARTEVEIGKKIYDIVEADGSVIEIQTQNLSKLLPKAEIILSAGKRFKIVHPIPVQKTIQLYDKDGSLISKRKSPKKESVYSLFKELTGIYPILLKNNFTLEVPLITMTEIRLRTDTAVQSENKRRRFKRNWLKTDKILESIIETKLFSEKEDYLNLLPETLPRTFSVKNLRDTLKSNRELPSSASSYANIMLWVLKRMELIEETNIKGRSKTYRIKDTE
ncbi:MAG: hypothetical protein ACTTKL_01665 [Treponema sp.]